ncbi:MAG TPA: hypothetical protein VHX14_24565, partial [Thermoanaerobaculia bacterium]|nr:hypothetical protein [Thermoanaerobaculia bacterium]
MIALRALIALRAFSVDCASRVSQLLTRISRASNGALKPSAFPLREFRDALKSSAFSPRAFRGEKVAKPDVGGFARSHLLRD